MTQSTIISVTLGQKFENATLVDVLFAPSRLHSMGHANGLFADPTIGENVLFWFR